MTDTDSFSERMPEWARSVRFRLALLYSLALFTLASLLVGALYLALHESVKEEPVSRTYITPQGVVITDVRDFERAVNENTLDTLKDLSFTGLGLLFVASLGIGWVIAGRVLSPIGRITDVANEIEATDLSRKIDLEGPDDELKRLAETFDRMLGRLDEAFSMQKKFIADASHELRNPLTIIRTNVELLLGRPNAGPDEVQRTGDVLRRATERMERLIDDLLALARLESAGVEWTDVDIAVLLEEVAEEHAASARERAVELLVDAQGKASVQGDPEALKRAVTNLVQNALRLAPGGSSVSLSVHDSDGGVELSVADRGPGIAEQDIEHVFERFYRTDVARSRASGGSGLGLAIVRQIAEAHRGRASVESISGEGATFTLWLPTAPSVDLHKASVVIES